VNDFKYEGNDLFAEQVPLAKIAKDVGTPAYVYSAATLTRHVEVLKKAFASVESLICYSVKANSNLALLKLIAQAGCGFDIVSEGELRRVLAAGGDAGKVVFSGVGKTESEMRFALSAGIRMFNVESAEELSLLDAVGRSMGKPAPFALRVNPDVDARTHKYIATGLKTSKFGVPFKEGMLLYKKSKTMKGLRAVGVDVHIGSQLTQVAPVKAAMSKVAELYLQVKKLGLPLDTLDVGGGLGITYNDEKPPSPVDYAKVVTAEVKHLGARLVLEPGRVLVGNAGVLLTRVIYRKKTQSKRFVIVDAGMNDLIRPALYEAHHGLLPLKKRKGTAVIADVAGPVCESSDVLARQRKLIWPEQGDLYAVASAGAYGMVMASNYNSRPRPVEVLVEGDGYRVVRPRESFEDLYRGEG
jgi:diaminopimelate decarboxylase